MLSNFQTFVNCIKEFWQEHQQEIILFIAVVLISLLSFATGFITAKLQGKEPLQIIEQSAESAQENSSISGK